MTLQCIQSLVHTLYESYIISAAELSYIFLRNQASAEMQMFWLCCLALTFAVALSLPASRISGKLISRACIRQLKMVIACAFKHANY